MEILFTKKLEKFIKNLDDKLIARTLRIIDLLEEFGNELKLPHSKSIGNNMFELRIRGKKEIRIIYVFKNNKAILLHGFVKKSEKIPAKQIATAINELNNYIGRT